MNNRLLFLVCGIFTLQTVTAQDSSARRTREFWAGAQDLRPLNLHISYKQSIGASMFWRISISNFALSSTNLNPKGGSVFSGNDRFSAGLQTGLEFRSPVKGIFNFFHGPGISGFVRLEKNNHMEPVNSLQQQIQVWQGGVYYSLGGMFNLGKGFFIAGELRPHFHYTQTIIIESPLFTNLHPYRRTIEDYGLAASDLLKISVAYRL